MKNLLVCGWKVRVKVFTGGGRLYEGGWKQQVVGEQFLNQPARATGCGLKNAEYPRGELNEVLNDRLKNKTQSPAITDWKPPCLH